MVCAGLVVFAGAATAQTPAANPDERIGGNTFITPFPEADTYRIQVYGDPYADGLLAGLTEAFGTDDPRLVWPKKPRTIAGLIRYEMEEDFKAEEASKEVLHIAIIMVGLYDRGPFRNPNARRIQLGSEEWSAEYGRRVDRLIKILKKRGAAVYWVGLPIVRNPGANDDVQVMNEIAREKAYQNGARFIDVYAGFADEGGSFVQWGPDLNGKPARLREGDGVTFTSVGNRKLAHFLEKELKRDIAAAKGARAIPLAGAEPEQKRLVAARGPVTPTTTPAAQAGWTANVGREPRPGATAPTKSATPSGPPDQSADQKADTARVTFKTTAGGRDETVTMDIVRPAIPGAVIALITRREAAERITPPGDTLADDTGGVTMLSSLIAAGEPVLTGLSANRGPRRSGPATSAQFRVLVKGEALPAKPGRADDFRWPRADASTDVVPATEIRRAGPRVAPARPASPRN
jgi:hypothetical protein